MSVPQPNSFRTGPDERGHFGIYGGRFVAETLMPNILELEKAYVAAKADPKYLDRAEECLLEACDRGYKNGAEVAKHEALKKLVGRPKVRRALNLDAKPAK